MCSGGEEDAALERVIVCLCVQIKNFRKSGYQCLELRAFLTVAGQRREEFLVIRVVFFAENCDGRSAYLSSIGLCFLH